MAGDAAGHASGRGAALHDFADGGRGEACRRRMAAPANAAEIADVPAPLLIGLAAEHRQGAGAIGHARDVGHVGGGNLTDPQQHRT